MSETPKTKFLMNGRYGGFGFSDFFRVEFLRRNPDVTLDAFRELEMSDEIKVRADKRLVDLVLELGVEDSSGPCCCLVIDEDSSDVLPFIKITEYDGLESRTLSFERFAFDLLNDIVSDERTVLSPDLRARYDFLKSIISNNLW